MIDSSLSGQGHALILDDDGGTQPLARATVAALR